MAHRQLAEGEVAGRGVEDDVGAMRREPGPRTLGHPGVLADLEAEADAVLRLRSEREEQIAKRHLDPADPCRGRAAFMPGLEPARLVVDAIAGEMLLGHASQHPSIGDHRYAIEQRAVVQARQTETHHQPVRLGQQFEQHAFGLHHDVGAMEGVLAAIAGDAQLGQAEQADLRGAGVTDGGQDALLVPVPIERGLVEDGGGEGDPVHACSVPARAARINANLRSCSPLSRPTG